MKKDIQSLLIPIITRTLEDLGLDKTQTQDLYMDLPTDPRFGDLYTNIAFRLASFLKKQPSDIAASIVSGIKARLKDAGLEDSISEIKIEGKGFINFYFTNSYFYDELREIAVLGKDALKVNAGGGKRVLIEFVSANPTGPLSVAHARQAAVGDILANVLYFLGFKVAREYYLNDEGNQINILGESIALRRRELAGEKTEFPENYYQGDYIYDIAKDSEKDKIKEEDLREYGVKYILEIIKKELTDFGVGFDSWFSQKELARNGAIEKALELFKKEGFLYEEEGAVWFKSTQFGDDKDRVVIKSDGSFTYLAPDIAYHQDKFKRGFSWLINLWGPDHHGYINRLKAAVKAMGKDAGALSVIIVQLAAIFKDGKQLHMSTRKGQYITLREVLDEVGRDAARFFFLMRRTSSHLDFDLDVAKKQTSENPVYYVQYAYARISSILENSKTKIDLGKLDLSALKEKEEIGLIKKICQFPYILNICLTTQDPYMLTVYLQGLAENFHIFYDKHRVLGDDPNLTQARLALIMSTKNAIATALELMGVSMPEKM